MSRWLPQAILIVALYAIAAINDPCGDGGCTRKRRQQVMDDDDMTWWHHQDQLMQELEEQERIEACNRAIDELKENDDAE